MMYYSLALFHAIVYLIGEIHNVISSLISEPCEFFLPSYLFAFQHLCIFTANCGLVLSLVALCCERGVATIRFNKYESNGIAFGLFLVLLTIIGVVATTIYVYDVSDFDAKVFSFSLLPPGAVEEYNKVAVANIITCFLCILILHISSRVNKKRCATSGATLSSRYQTRENVITTQFAVHIATLQVTFFVLQAIGGILARRLGDYYFSGNEKLCTSLRHMSYLAAMFTFMLPIYSLRQLKYYRSKRQENIQSIVSLESRGIAGTENYDHIITKLW
ncbi:integral membrane protein Srb [Dictyocaulus viviparus]|uniref:Integral membrane protein Srb n=1 Tax=Dictyocaulus viviparus TaxID=29172 RepID=A0A0D8X849_DICVI|nr:integral membrane protein Srb [Dictyocaulus viviparus]